MPILILIILAEEMTFKIFHVMLKPLVKRIGRTIPNIINELTPLVREKLSTLNFKQFTNCYQSFIIASYKFTCRIHQCYICNRRYGIYWGKVVNLSVKSTIKWAHVYFVEKKHVSFIKHPLIIITLSSLLCDLPPSTLIEWLERDFSMTYFCINNAYACECYLLCPLPGSALITWWLPWQRFIEAHYDVIQWKHFPRYWFLWGEFTGHRWIPLTKASDAELGCFLWSVPKQTAEQTIETPVILDPIVLIMTSL